MTFRKCGHTHVQKTMLINMSVRRSRSVQEDGKTGLGVSDANIVLFGNNTY